MPDESFLDISVEGPAAPKSTNKPDGPTGDGSAFTPGTTLPVDDEFHVSDYLRALSRRRWTGLATFLIVFTAVAVYTYTVQPMYDARAEVLIENESDNTVAFKQVVEEAKTRDYYNTQYRVLQSRTLVKKALESQNLWAEMISIAPKGGFAATLSAAVSAVKRVGRSFSGEAESQPGSNESATEAAAIGIFLSHLTIAPVRDSRLVDITFTAPNAELSARAANALAHAYVAQNLEVRLSATREASGFLADQLQEQRKAVEASESSLQKYREQNDSLSLEDRQNIVVQRLADLNTAVTKARTERIQKEAAYNQVRNVEAGKVQVDNVPGILLNSYVQQQKAEIGELQRQLAQYADRLGDRHPEMIRVRSALQSAETRLHQEIAKVIQGIRSEAVAAAEEERNLTAALEQQKNEAMALNRRAIDYGVLERDAVSNRQVYESLLQRTKETGITGELRTNNIRIVDLAEVPGAPARPKRGLNLLLGFGGGIFVALLVVFGAEYMDNRIKAPEEIRDYLGVPFFGMIPAVHEELSAAVMASGGPHDFAEAFRSLRTNLLFSSAEDGSRSLVITSTAPGEGKTVVSTNLARALATTGLRVLLIDADMRRPRVHEVFDQPQEPGLSNVIVGNAKPSDAIHRTGVENLWLLTAGRLPPNPAELLASQRFRNFVHSLGKHFDWVVIDSPPVLAVTDSVVVAHDVQSVLFVIGCEMTARAAAKNALDHLARAGVPVSGAVLNRVDFKHNAYYYSKYYRREYANYYTDPSRAAS